MTLRRAVSIVAGLEAVAVALWLIPASVHIIAWGTDGPRRIALLASRTLLMWLVGAALVASVALLIRLPPSRMTRFGVPGKADPTQRFEWLSLLWLWAVPFLPWLPDRVPLLLLLAGPLRWVVAAVAVALAFRRASVRLTAFAKATAVRRSFTRRRTADPTRRFGRRTVFITSLVVYLVLGALHARAIGPGGDEPHYLVITHSLLVDRDLLIENNHTRRDYLAFFGGPLRPDYMRRGLNGEIYSIHAPGLPVLVLPAYAVAGYAGVVAFLCLIAALTALAVFDLAAALAGPRPAMIAWAAVALTVPFMPHSWLIFPELPGALIVAWAALWVWKPVDQLDRGSAPDRHPNAQRPRVGDPAPGSVACGGPDAPRRSLAGALCAPMRTWLWRGAVLAILPWLHTKFIIFLAVFGGALFLRIWRRPRAAVAMTIPIAVSIAGWFAYFYVIYGSFNPEAPYGAYTAVNVVARNIPRGLFGLIVDQKFGLLVYSPIYVFAIAGCWRMLRLAEWRWLGIVLLAAVALHVGSTTRLYMWWGGNSAPARFLVPILPCLAPMIAVAVNGVRARASRALLWTTFAVSLVIAFGGLAAPRRLLLFSDPRGKSRLVELVQGPAPLSAVLPTFTQEDWRSPIANFVALRVTSVDRTEAAHKGVMDLLWRYDAGRLRAFDYARLRRLDQSEVLEASTLVVERRRVAADANQRMIAGPFTLPPGAYEARIRLADARPREGEFVVSSSDRAIFARRADMGSAGTSVDVQFQLPVAVGRLTLTASTPQLASAVTEAEFAPMAVVPPHDRGDLQVRTIESLPERPDAYVVYLNEHAYPEGGVFWTRGTGAAQVSVAAAGVRRLVLTLDSGPRENDVRMNVAGVERAIRTAAGKATSESFDVPPGMRLIPVTIQAKSFFRPAELDPSSGDNRGLGCHVRINLE